MNGAEHEKLEAKLWLELYTLMGLFISVRYVCSSKGADG